MKCYDWNEDCFIIPEYYRNFQYNFKNKRKLIRQYVFEKENEIIEMIKINGLPETIPERAIKLQLINAGHVCVAAVNGENLMNTKSGLLYSFVGGFSGIWNAYYFPTEYVVNNPYLNFNKTLKIDEDCIIIKNDSLMLGLQPIISKYSSLIAEVDISIRMATINSRTMTAFTGVDDRQLESCRNFFRKLEEGELDVLADGDFAEMLNNHIKSIPFNTSTGNAIIKDLIELRQYLVARMNHDLGLNENFNMKREALNAAETGVNEDSLEPRIDNIFDNWKEGFDKVNDMFGTDISIELSSAWKKQDEKNDLKIDMMEAQIDQTDPEPKSEEAPGQEDKEKDGEEDADNKEE